MKRPSRVTGAFVLRRDGAQAWVLVDAAGALDVGAVTYNHAADGNHYRPWVMIDGIRHGCGDAVPQLAMAARAVEAAVIKNRQRQ